MIPSFAPNASGVPMLPPALTSATAPLLTVTVPAPDKLTFVMASEFTDTGEALLVALVSRTFAPVTSVDAYSVVLFSGRNPSAP